MESGNLSAEEWCAVPDYEGMYEVSDHGRVRTIARTKRGSDGRIVRVQSRIRVGTIDRGYRVIWLSAEDGSKRHFFVHRLVLLAFVGPCPEGMEACHGRGGSLDNRPSNLRWDTSLENARDVVRHGNNRNAAKTHCHRGHELTHPNLVPGLARRGYRGCRACGNEASRANRVGQPFDVKRADRRFEELMKSTPESWGEEAA